MGNGAAPPSHIPQGFVLVTGRISNFQLDGILVFPATSQIK